MAYYIQTTDVLFGLGVAMRMSRLCGRFGGALGGALGVALGVSLATCPSAAADPIDDAWPYPGFDLGGYLNQQSFDDLEPYLFGLGRQGTLDYTDFAGTTPLYSTHADFFSFPVLPFLYTYTHNHQEVFDSAVPTPLDGTVMDRTDLLSSFGGDWSIHHTWIYDPESGFGDLFQFGGFANTLIINDIGIQDTFTFLTSEYTLIDFQWPDGLGDPL